MLEYTGERQDYEYHRLSLSELSGVKVSALFGVRGYFPISVPHTLYGRWTRRAAPTQEIYGARSG
jgi:hypothetical protein